MQKQKQTKARLFEPRLFPMDLARLSCLPIALLHSVKRFTPEGEKYTDRLRGGAVITANHTSFHDPIAVGLTFWYRRMFFLAAEAVMQKGLRRWLLQGAGAVEINRFGFDIEAINKTVKILKTGRPLSVFPSGNIEEGEENGAIKSGAVLIALRAGVPIIPMHILPQKKIYHRPVVIIGKPIIPAELCSSKFPSTADINKITDALAEELLRCKNAADSGWLK